MIEIIPAIDILDGKCVRLIQGDYEEQKIYSDNPLEVAKQFEDVGVRYLHLVDLDGAKSSEPRNLKILQEITSSTHLKVEWGGGVKTTESLQKVIDSGAERVICGSIAVDNPTLFAQWLKDFGSEHVVLGADVRGEQVATHGWMKLSQITVFDLINRFIPNGLSQVICTDITRDGMMQGPNWNLYLQLQGQFLDIDFTLSGGVSSPADVEKANEIGLRRVIIGKAFYEGLITLNNLKGWLQKE